MSIGTNEKSNLVCMDDAFLEQPSSNIVSKLKWQYHLSIILVYNGALVSDNMKLL
jgi:hypothetical protein